jgi:hypothetical protein
MTVYDADRIYRLLPSIHRLRDADEGGTLEALLSVLAREIGIVEADIERLYANGFIETCDEWVVPYIGDLLGVRPVHGVSAATFSARAYVANTLAYRRRKGTATVLEQLARDVTGWPARAVEFFERLTATQYMNHPRPHCRTTVDLRDMNGLELAHGPFGAAAHHADVRRIGAPTGRRRGRYNIPNVGLFLWRIQDYPVAGGTAREITPGCFTFNPVGLDAPLLNAPRTETEITHLADEINVPAPLRRRALYEELEGLRSALARGDDPALRYFAPPAALSLYLDEENDPVPPEQIVICHLGDWRTPPDSLDYEKPDDSTDTRPITAAVDPVLGRVRLGDTVDAAGVRVDYGYGFSGDYGGGPYDRGASLDAWLDPFVRPVTWQIGVTGDPDTHAGAPDPAQLVDTLDAAVDAWNAHAAANPGAFGVIAVMDSRSYTGNLNGAHRIEVPEGSRLAVVAAHWPVVPAAGGVGTERVVGQLVTEGLRPHLDGDLSVVGTAPASSDEGGELVIDGLLVEGGLTVLKGNLGRLRLSHVTLVPSEGGLGCNTDNPALEVVVSRSILGPIALPESVPVLEVADSIVDSDDDVAIDAPGAAARLERVTVRGSTGVRTLEASEVIFTDQAVAERRQAGCVRFSCVPAGSRVGRRYRCQPDLEVAERVAAAEDEAGSSLSQPEKDAIAQEVAGWLVPGFTSVRYGDPAYFQLDRRCPVQIRTGAEDGAEMGVFHDLMQAHREANLRAALDEYLRAGLEAGVFHGS